MKIVPTAVALATALVLAASVASAQPASSPGHLLDLESVASDLGLSPEQVERIRTLVDRGRKEQVSLRARMEVIEIDLRRELSREVPDEKKVGAWADELGTLDGAARKSKILTQLRLRSVLSADQRRRFEAMRSRAAASKPARPDPAPTPGGGCDEVTCLVDPDLACCPRRGRDRLGRQDISAGITKVRGQVLDCGSQHDFAGTVKARITIAPSGRPSSVSVEGGPPAANRCITKALRQARFPVAKEPITVSYPFVLRR